MKNILSKIKKFFTKIAITTPGISAVVYKVADKLDSKQEKEELKQRILNQPRSVQVIEKNILGEGVSAMKRNMRENMHLFGEGKTYRTVDEHGEEHGFDLLSYAPGKNEQRADLLKKTTDLTVTDVKTDTEKMEMIEKRISHYKELHRAKAQREFIRKMRYETDPTKREELESDFRDQFGYLPLGVSVKR